MQPIETLTDKKISLIDCPADKSKIEVSDPSLKGFYVEVRANSEHKTYYQRVNMPDGKRRTLKVGLSSEIGIKEARNIAIRLKSDCLSGALDRQIAEQKSCIKFNDFLDQHYYPYASKHKRYKTVYAHQSLMKTHIRNDLGKLPINKIKASSLRALMDKLIDLGRKPATINKLINGVQQVIRFAIDLGHLEQSEALKVKLLNDTQKKERFLSEDETIRLIKVLNDWHVKPVALLLKFTLFTGARIGEVMKANWQDINLETKTWYIPVENDKVKKGRIVPLNDTAVTILQEALLLKTAGQEEVFRSIQCKTRYKSVMLSWYNIRAAAGIEGVRIHDLRHSYASHLVKNKVPLIEVSKLLGHSSIKTTMRYAHLDNDTIRQSSKVMDKFNITQ
jgi:integrase